MFTKEQIENLQKQLYEIQDELCLNLKETKDEAWWPTPFYINVDEYELRESYDIFNGNCGIILFFLDLYKFDGNDAHLKLVIKGMHRVLNSEAIKHPKFFAFYTGLAGVIYTCLRIFEVIGDTFYKEKALDLTLINQKQLTEELLKTDLLSGYTGNLFVLTLLYHHTDNVQVLSMVNQLIERLIAEARVSEKGLKWDYFRSKKAYDSMTGFSHGASGIAWILMQLSTYFDAKGLMYLAEEALKHEMQYFYEPAQNWLDLRLGPHRLNKPNVYEWKLDTFLPEMTNVNAWAHGAAGIGLARQMAFRLTEKKEYLEHADWVLKRCLSDLAKPERSDFTLVSGYSGMIPFLLNGTNEKSFEAEISFIIDHAAKQREKTGSLNTYVSCGSEDYGLFSGKSGIGYIILNILMNSSENLLQPQLPKQDRVSDFSKKYSRIEIKKQIFSAYFKRTLDGMKHISSDIFEVGDIDDFKSRLEDEILEKNIGEINGLFKLECKILTLWKKHKGYFSFDQKNKHLRKIIDETLLLNDQDLKQCSFEMVGHIGLHQFDKEGNQENLLLLSDENGVREINIGSFASVILNALERKMKGVELVKSLERMFSNGNETEKLENIIIQQLRLLIKAGFIEVLLNKQGAI